jgi:hypothetical protein
VKSNLKRSVDYGQRLKSCFFLPLPLLNWVACAPIADPCLCAALCTPFLPPVSRASPIQKSTTALHLPAPNWQLNTPSLPAQTSTKLCSIANIARDNEVPFKLQTRGPPTLPTANSSLQFPAPNEKITTSTHTPTTPIARSDHCSYPHNTQL